MEIRIAGIVNDSIVDGPGFRLAVFTQGCPHDCPGCHNPATHPFDGGRLESTDKIVETMADNPLLDGSPAGIRSASRNPARCSRARRRSWG